MKDIKSHVRDRNYAHMQTFSENNIPEEDKAKTKRMWVEINLIEKMLRNAKVHKLNDAK